MKNVIIGLSATIFLLLSSMVCLTLFGSSTRKNEMEHGLSRCTEDLLEKYYSLAHEPSEKELPTREELSEELLTQLKAWVASDTELSVDVQVCDFEKGILSLVVTESYQTPLGKDKEESYKKTAIVDRKVDIKEES